MYERAQRDPDGFWAEQAERLDWIKFPSKIKNTSFTGNIDCKWYEDGTLNASATCLDKHLATRGDQVAIIWEGDDPNSSQSITYRQLHDQVCRLANVLKSFGVKKSDRVTIYLPMVIEAAVAMLACARIGAVHSIVFGGFSPDSLANRVQDCGAEVLITADEGRRGGRTVPLKTNANAALKECPGVKHVIVAHVTGGQVPMQEGRDHSFEESRQGLARLQAGGDERRGPAVHPLHIRQHRQAEGRTAYHRRLHGVGQLHARVGVRLPSRRRLLVHGRRGLGHGTHRTSCMGQLANGATTLMFEGVPSYPDSSALLAGRR